VPKSMRVAASLTSVYLQSERSNFHESARKRFLAAARRRLIGGGMRGIPSHSHVDDHRRRGDRLFSYDFFEDDSKSMFHELAPERVKATAKRKPRSTVSPRDLPFRLLGKTENFTEFLRHARRLRSPLRASTLRRKKVSMRNPFVIDDPIAVGSSHHRDRCYYRRSSNANHDMADMGNIELERSSREYRQNVLLSYRRCTKT